MDAEQVETTLMGSAIEQHGELMDLPRVGAVITGHVLDKGRNTLYLDLDHFGVGVVYGKELFDDADTFRNSKIGDPVQATVQNFDNEDNMVELSLRSASEGRSWSELQRRLENGEIFETTVLDANKGGLMVRISGVMGFLPVSQLAPDHYPRVEGGDKQRILERLGELIGITMKVKVIAASQDEDKLIVSEKAAASDEMSSLLEGINEGDVIDGAVSGVVDFGVFVKFELDGSELEGLVHISELAWQRVDSPADYLKVGEPVKAKIIAIDKLRISLSIKQLQEDPWMHAKDRYEVGSVVEGEVIKVTQFGGFVKLDEDIHGLVHVSELPEEAHGKPENVLTVGERRKFTIISLQPEEHRLGLSLRTTQDEDPEAEKKSSKKK